MTKFVWDEGISFEDARRMGLFGHDDDDFPPEEEDEDNPNAYRWPEPDDEYWWDDEAEEPAWESALQAYYRSHPGARRRTVSVPPLPSAGTPPRSQPAPRPKPPRPELTITERKAIGHAFEEWVAEMFPSQWFELVTWQSDKTTATGRIARDSLDPDLMFELCRRPEVQIAVECKWRRALEDGAFPWKQQREQLGRYHAYAVRTGRPVFLVLGVGGTPSRPRDIYLVPLDSVDDQPLTSVHLSCFRRHRRLPFSYDPDKNQLV